MNVQGEEGGHTFSSIRATVLAYRQAIHSTDSEKALMVDEIRNLSEELDSLRREKGLLFTKPHTGSSNSAANRTSSSSPQRSFNEKTPQVQIIPKKETVSSAGSSSGGSSSNERDQVNTSNSSPQQQQQQQQKQSKQQQKVPPIAFIAKDHLAFSQMTTSALSTARSRHAEDLEEELERVTNETDMMSRELQRLHQGYQSEIKRLHRMIAKLEGQLLDLSAYA